MRPIAKASFQSYGVAQLVSLLCSDVSLYKNCLLTRALSLKLSCALGCKNKSLMVCTPCGVASKP